MGDLLVSCSRQVPQQYEQLRQLPPMYPDYADVTIPPNIAPLSFEVFAEGDDAVTRISAGGRELVCSGMKIRPDIGQWHELLSQAQGTDVTASSFQKYLKPANKKLAKLIAAYEG